MAPSRAEIDAIIEAASNTTSATIATITTLKHLLDIPTSTADQTAASKSQPSSRRNAIASKNAARSRVLPARPKAASNVEVLNEDTPALSTKDRYVFATQIFNASIRAISNAAKHPVPRSRAASPRPRSPQQHGRALAARSPNSPGKRANVRKPSAYPSTGSSQATKSVAVVAECVRLTLGYVRTHGKQVPAGTLDTQLENATLGYVGNCLTLGLDNIALKELKALKRRLEAVLGPSSSVKNGVLDKSETYSCMDILRLSCPTHPDSAVTSIITKYHNQASRVILGRLNHKDIELLLEHLDLSHLESPLTILVQQARSSKDSAPFIRQLEQFINALLAACPSISTDSDNEACNPQRSITPSAALRIHVIIWKCRLILAGLDDRVFSLEKDYWRPLHRCFAAYTRRVQLISDKDWSIAEDQFRQLILAVSTSHLDADGAASRGVISQIMLNLSTLAQLASQMDDAIRWAREHQQNLPEEESNTARAAISAIRIACLYLQDRNTEDLSSIMMRAHATLMSSLRGDSSELDLLLLEVAGYRRALMARILAEPDAGQATFERDCRNGIYSCLRYLMRYAGKPLGDQSDPAIQARQTERFSKARKAAPGFTDSVFHCCKIALKDASTVWRDFDSAIDESIQLALILDDATAETKYCHSAVAMKAANLYWTYYRSEASNAGEISSVGIRALKRSVSVLQTVDSATREKGQYAQKLEKLAQVYRGLQHYDSSFDCIQQILQEHFTTGLLGNLTELSNSCSYDKVWSSEIGSIVGKSVDELLLLLQHADRRGRTSFGFHDDDSLDSAKRGLLLERQLVSYSSDILKPGYLRHACQVERLSSALSTLLRLYDRQTYPIRRQRVILLCSKLSHLLSSAFGDEFDAIIQESSSCLQDIQASKDSGLSRYHEHLEISKSVSQLLNTTKISVPPLEAAVNAWMQISKDSANFVAERIDHLPLFISSLVLLNELCGVQCFPKLQISILGLLETVLSAEVDQDLCAISDILVQISLLQLRMGYSGSAGMTLARAHAVIIATENSSEEMLRYHLAHAEYLLAIGASSKCIESLRLAESIVSDDALLVSRRAASITDANKMRRMLIHALQVSSGLKLKNGYPAAALKDAKMSLKLLQRTWSALENDKIPPAATRDDSGLSTSELGVSVSTQGLPILRSLTHDALRGAKMWHLVPALIQSYQHISNLYKHFGMFSESSFWIDCAQKIVSVLPSPTSQLCNLSLVAEHHIESGDIEDGQSSLDRAMESFSEVPPSLELVRHYQSVARMWKARKESDDELESLEAALAMIDELAHQSPRRLSEKMPTTDDQLVVQLAEMQIGIKKASKPVRATRGRAAPDVAAPKKKAVATRPKVVQPIAIRTLECAPLATLKTQLMIEKALTLLNRQDLTSAANVISSMTCDTIQSQMKARRVFAEAKLALLQTMKSFSSSCTFGMLSESTISVPSQPLIETKDVNAAESKQTITRVTKALDGRKVTKAKATKKTSNPDLELVASLCTIRDKLVEIQPLASRLFSVAEYGEVCSLLANVSVFVSATNQQSSDIHVHANSAALLIDQPSMHATRLSKAASMAGDRSMTREELYTWPPVALLHDTTFDQISSMSPAQFQELYIDIIPEPWTAVSLHLSESKEELYIAKYRKGQSPFVLRMPLTPHNHALVDGFTYEDGKEELRAIIAESFETTHNPIYVETKEAKKEWWNLREALDQRIHELLQNIEKIWLGGFRGVFAPCVMQPELLMKLQKDVLASLCRHLPSRQGKKAQKPIVLDTRVWEMFTGLGDPRDETVDMDESLVDLLYFIVDILQFGGETNAYDEVDFDSIVIETLDSLKAYYSAITPKNNAEKEHTILILDQNLHMFPWESMPCLAHKNVSRLPSLEDLRMRILAMKASAKKTSETCKTGHHVSKVSGSSLLNPSGDLQTTETVLRPLLATLPDKWAHSTAAPSDKELLSTLSNNSLFIYFGHGSGSQYITNQQVRILQSCPTTWLMGCSSAKLKCNGDVYLPSGMVLSYLAAGAPAVVGTLWDVTDKDCDRASVHMGETWGLWRSQGQHKLLALKGRQRSAETEQARGARGNTGRGKRAGMDMANARANRSAKEDEKISLVESVRLSRDQCYLRYLNGSALVVYGIPVYLDD